MLPILPGMLRVCFLAFYLLQICDSIKDCEITLEGHSVMIETMKMLLDAGSKMDESSAIFSILPLAVEYKCNLIDNKCPYHGGKLMLVLEVIKLIVSSITGPIEDAIGYMKASLATILNNVADFVEEYEACLLIHLTTDSYDVDVVDNFNIIIERYTNMIDCLRSIVVNWNNYTNNTVFGLVEDAIENGDFYECAFMNAFVKIARYPPEYDRPKRLIFVILGCLNDSQMSELSGILSKRLEDFPSVCNVDPNSELYLRTKNALEWVRSFESTICVHEPPPTLESHSPRSVTYMMTTFNDEDFTLPLQRSTFEVCMDDDID